MLGKPPAGGGGGGGGGAPATRTLGAGEAGVEGAGPRGGRAEGADAVPEAPGESEPAHALLQLDVPDLLLGRANG